MNFSINDWVTFNDPESQYYGKIFKVRSTGPVMQSDGSWLYKTTLHGLSDVEWSSHGLELVVKYISPWSEE